MMIFRYMPSPIFPSYNSVPYIVSVGVFSRGLLLLYWVVYLVPLKSLEGHWQTILSSSLGLERYVDTFSAFLTVVTSS
jgi:hypothetical protein